MSLLQSPEARVRHCTQRSFKRSLVSLTFNRLFNIGCANLEQTCTIWVFQQITGTGKLNTDKKAYIKIERLGWSRTGLGGVKRNFREGNYAIMLCVAFTSFFFF